MKLEYTFDNLILKVCNEADVFSVLEFYSDNRAYFDQYEPDKPDNFYTKEYMLKLLRSEYNTFLQGTFVRFFLYDKKIPNHIIGTVSFSHILSGAIKTCTIGYKVDHNFQRQGYCRRMLTEALEIMSAEKGMHRIEAYVHPDNIPSIAVVNSLKFTNEGIAHSYIRMNGKWQDHLRYVHIS